MVKPSLTVRAKWDDQAAVWIATSDDVPGLCCEASSFDRLIAEVLALVPELLVSNRVLEPAEAAEVPVTFVAERRMVARLVA